MPTDGGLLLPGESPDASIKRPVGRDEFERRIGNLEARLRNIVIKSQLAPQRIEALLKFLAYCPKIAWTVQEGVEPGFNIGAFWAYADRYAGEATPATIEAVHKPTILERLAVAAEWNAENPDMPILADELWLRVLVQPPGYGRITEEEERAIEAFPATAEFREGWRESLRLNVEFWVTKGNGDLA